jgi:hypothetical protein
MNYCRLGTNSRPRRHHLNHNYRNTSSRLVWNQRRPFLPSNQVDPSLGRERSVSCCPLLFCWLEKEKGPLHPGNAQLNSSNLRTRTARANPMKSFGIEIGLISLILRLAYFRKLFTNTGGTPRRHSRVYILRYRGCDPTFQVCPDARDHLLLPASDQRRTQRRGSS